MVPGDSSNDFMKKLNLDLRPHRHLFLTSGADRSSEMSPEGFRDCFHFTVVIKKEASPPPPLLQGWWEVINIFQMHGTVICSSYSV